MDNNTRREATKYVWTAVGWALFALFIGTGMGGGIQAGHTILGVAVLVAATGSTGFIWNFGDLPAIAEKAQDDAEQEKVKRERIDTVLRDLSSEELIALKNRLSDGIVDDDLLYDRMRLSDDGELVAMEANYE